MNPFSEACAMTGPLQVRLEGPNSKGGSRLEFDQPFLVIGRDESVDLPIDSPEVSRRHAYVQVVAGRVFCLDLESRTGVRWKDGTSALGWVQRQEWIEIGPTRISFDGQAVGPDEKVDLQTPGGNLPLSRSFEWSTPPQARLEFLGDHGEREPWQISRSLVILGRSPTCRVRLEGPEISKIHAAILRTPTGIWAIDLFGREPRLKVRGETARFARLEDGNEIELGRHRIQIRIGPPAQFSGGCELARRPRERVTPPAPREFGPLSSLGQNVGDGNQNLDKQRRSLDPVTERLFEQFDRMHQQTTEQFRQAILMMFRMHQDQMSLIRDELSRLDSLEEERRALQTELSRGRVGASARAVLRVVSGDDTESAPPTSPTSLQIRAVPAQPSTPDPAENRAPRSVESVESSHHGASPKTGIDRSSSVDAHDDPHARLYRRLAEIQQERQGLWQKLLGSLGGSGSQSTSI